MVDYTRYSYDALVDEATRLVRDVGGFGDAYNSSDGQMHIQLLAAMVDKLMYMLSRRTREAYLPVARLSSSIRMLASSLGYRPRRKVSANGTLQVNLVDSGGLPNPIGSDGNTTDDQILPAFTEFYRNDYTFVNPNEVIVPYADGTTDSFTVDVEEGVYRKQEFVVSETPTLDNDSFIVLPDYENIVENSIVINDDNGEFFDVTKSQNDNPAIGALSFADSTDPAFDIRIVNEGLIILFGNNTFGKKPQGTVTVEYIESQQDDVEINTIGLPFEFEGSNIPFSNSDPFVTQYEIENTTAITGELLPESDTRIKINAPDYVRTADRAVTSSDFEFWTRRSGIGGIIAAHAYGQEETGIDPFKMNLVYITYLNEQNSKLTTTEEKDLRSYLSRYKMVTTHLVFEKAEEIPMQLNLQIKRNPKLTISNSEVYSIVKNQLVKYFNINRDSINNSFIHSDLVQYLHNYVINSGGSGGSERSLLSSVYIDAKALKPFTSPLEAQDYSFDVLLGTDGDDYIVTVNGSNVQYTQVAGDTDADIAAALASGIDALANVSSSSTDNTVTVTGDSETSFTISNQSSTVPSNIVIEHEIQIPPRIIKNEDNEDLIEPGSVEIIDIDGNVLDDDSSGSLANGTIDYKTALVTIPLQAHGDYYVRYRQNNRLNVEANQYSFIGVLEPKDQYLDTVEELSTIELV